MKTHDMINNQKDSSIVLVSLVAPFYNEVGNVDEFFRRVYSVFDAISSKYDLEVVAINDGSDDETLSNLIKISKTYNNVCIVDLSRNFGKEAAISAGLNYARGKIVIPIDADLQHPPELIPEMIQLWEEGNEVVVAKRKSRDTDRIARKFATRAFYRIQNLISDVDIPADIGDFRLMDLAVVKEINCLPESQRFMKGLFAWVGFKTTTIEYDVAPRRSGGSSFNAWRLWNYALDGITSFSTVPLRMWTYIGFLVSGLSFIFIVYLIIKTLILGADTPGFATLMVTILFIGGIQLIGIGVLGEYVGRTYNEVKNRPAYIARKVYRSND